MGTGLKKGDAQRWTAAAQEAIRAAEMCLGRDFPRSAVSRAYYAMFSAITAALLWAGETPRQPERTWPHASLPNMVRDSLARRVGTGRAKDIRQRLISTYKKRLDADYVPGRAVDRVTAMRALADAAGIFVALEVES